MTLTLAYNYNRTRVDNGSTSVATTSVRDLTSQAVRWPGSPTAITQRRPDGSRPS